MTGSTGATPLVLLINDEEWTTRSIESILGPQGYAVLTAYTGRQGLDLAARTRPDIILVDAHLPDVDGTELCVQLRRLSGTRDIVPILLVTSGPLDRTSRLDAYRCGAWAVLQPPFDPQEILARLEPYLRAKRAADAAFEDADVDPLTGCYNARGLLRRLKEIAADAQRTHRPVACIAIGLSGEEESLPSPGRRAGDPPRGADAEMTRIISDLLLTTKRTADAVARTGETDFVILAPGTDRDGADRIVERLIERLNGAASRVSLRAGASVASGMDSDTPNPEELLRRATSALRDAQGRNRVAAARTPVTPPGAPV